MGNPFILMGIILIAAGVLINMVPGLKPPILPGDIFIEREGFTIYVPIVSSFLLSLALTIILRLFH